MSGILEQIHAAINANTAALERIASAMAGGAVAPQPAPAPAPVLAAQPMAQPYVAPQPAPAAAPQVSAEALTALIQPHVANEAIKAALGAAMRGMGINALPEAQPHQYGSLYQAFQNVIAQHTGGIQQPQAAPAATSII